MSQPGLVRDKGGVRTPGTCSPPHSWQPCPGQLREGPPGACVPLTSSAHQRGRERTRLRLWCPLPVRRSRGPAAGTAPGAGTSLSRGPAGGMLTHTCGAGLNGTRRPDGQAIHVCVLGPGGSEPGGCPWGLPTRRGLPGPLQRLRSRETHVRPGLLLPEARVYL